MLDHVLVQENAPSDQQPGCIYESWKDKLAKNMQQNEVRVDAKFCLYVAIGMWYMHLGILIVFGKLHLPN